MVERAPGQMEKFQRVVELGAVGTVGVDDLPFELLQVGTEEVRT